MNSRDFVKELKDFTTKVYGIKYDQETVLIGVRGISIENDKVTLNDDSFDHFNDILFNIEAGGVVFDYRVVTLDPGKVSDRVLKDYGVTKGEARAEPGISRVALGDHRGHVALVQVSDIVVRRDANEDHIWDERDETYKGEFGIDVHAQSTDKDTVGVSSLGCTVTRATWTEPDWLNFIGAMLRADLEARKLNLNFKGFIRAIHDQAVAKLILGVSK
ncbi:hypothetical protein LEP1GSC050_0090 [Leptospira phage vB_LbrZ_5399-LE1]|uniref:Uncharacterized protein n=1 Tax=Leptospira inadai serovar Lyme TaxID=293084 RepID=A0ABX4YGF7_9LEPT|nr:hypothetical protein [Leptospira inadai]AGS80696.1 hypothetical protein LEP1GSC050_0090 [Leptospira phage vB_LbrZ_5399-LE1]AGS80823.1 hypothetical protein LEP1GSC047_0882 [Leptospira phage vB_LinZ_10-LE1]PNV74349.1 hypothetical protein BES34_014285 [Leptospira inadai serovar Lyme]